MADPERQDGQGAVSLVEAALDSLYRFCGGLAALAIVLIAVFVAVSVVSRLLGVYIGGMTEGAGYAMAAAGSLGCAYAFGAGAHIRVDLGLNACPQPLRWRLDQFATVLAAITVCFLAYYLVRMVRISWNFGDISDGSDGLPLWLPQLPAAIGFVVFAIALVHGALRYCLTGQSLVKDSDEALLERPEED
ncbi:TRAP transporter small permease [Roseovarius sp. E0-M6]|uniref:TRAP transporter small permease n=1 Tax=Roseovarius sp. E0-M6 TaxID=3127118 RepID=UPI00300FAD8C